MKITIGNLIDQLSIVNQRIWVLEDLRRDPNSSHREIAEVAKKINNANIQRNDLIEAIDEAMNDIAQGKQQQLYGQGSAKIYGKKQWKKGR